MKNYPKKTCEIEKLITNKSMVQLTIKGEKTRQGRNGVYGYPGEEFVLEGNKFVITDLYQENLGDINDKEAREEGYPDLNSYKNSIFNIHKSMVLNTVKNLYWNSNAKVWVHKFKKVEQ